MVAWAVVAAMAVAGEMAGGQIHPGLHIKNNIRAVINCLQQYGSEG
jgi:hypothetical protein